MFTVYFMFLLNLRLQVGEIVQMVSDTTKMILQNIYDLLNLSFDDYCIIVTIDESKIADNSFTMYEHNFRVGYVHHSIRFLCSSTVDRHLLTKCTE
jgi:hypothetical protein